MSKIKVLLVEDHSLTRVGLKYTLEKNDAIEIVGEAEDGKQAVEKTKELKPDIILMDLGMPNMNGIDATKIIKEDSSLNAKVIILTSHSDDDEVLSAFAAGADAYCMKDIEAEKLASAIISVNDGVMWIDPAVARVVMSNLNKPKSGHFVDPGLTPREKEVLALIVDGHSNADIAFKLTVSMHTVKTHISSVLSKLAVDDRTQAAVKAMKENII